MCGIVAAAAGSNIVPVLVEGLKKLEYRGYDSAGLAVISGDRHRARPLGRPRRRTRSRLGRHPAPSPASPTPAGPPTACPANATPTRTSPAAIAVVHNGIIENYESLRSELTAQGYVFTSDTDTESIAHLVQATLKTEPDLFKAVRIACRRLVGAYAIAVIDQQPARQGRRRPRRLAAAARRLRHRQLRRLRRLGAAAGHPQHGLSGKWRYCRVDRNRRQDHPPRRHPGRAPGACLAALRRRRRTRQLPALHAEGNLRAAGSAGQHPGNRRRQQDHPARHLRRRSRQPAGRRRFAS